jgi:Tol biopolymer transport system component
MPGNGSALTPLREASDRRLDSWKEIAAYLGRGVRSVQRWEREEGLPVHRLSHQKRGSVYAYKNELDEWWQSRRSSLAAEKPELREEPPLDVSQTTSRPRSLKFAVVAGVVIVMTAVVYFAVRHRAKASPEMHQLTHLGVVRPLGCSLSSDGKIVAFASDAAEEGNIDIWVQQTGRPEARRLTHDPGPDLDPSISPDGKTILFVSRRASRPGIYQIAAAGGQEKLLLPEGGEPRFSLDGKRIAYISGNRPHHLYVSEFDGSSAREIPTGMARLDHPIWSPDGKYLMVSGQRTSSEPADWWVIPIDGQEPINTKILHDLSRHISSSLRTNFYASAWLPGGRILFAGDHDGIWYIWRIQLLPGSFRLGGAPERVTGRRQPIGVSFAAAGNHLAFVDDRPDGQLWRLPVDTGTGQMTGNPRRITREGISQFPSISADGRILAYLFSRSGRLSPATDVGISVRNIETGAESSVPGLEHQYGFGYVTLTRDGSKLAYGIVVPGLKRPIYLYDLATRSTRKLCDDCEGRPYDWSPDGVKLILSMPGKGIGLMDISTGKRSVILRGSTAVLSPDGRWLAVSPGVVGQGGRISIVPFRGSERVPQNEWIAVGEPASEELLPAWSPGGELLYFISTPHSDPSHYVLKAQRLHPDSGRLDGQPFDVYRFEEPFVPLLRLPLNNRLAISPGQIILTSEAFKGDIWMTQIDGRK